MGRYYSGDIEGKFWFGVQSSDAASRFGGTESQPQFIEYYFDKEDDLESVEAEIKNIEESLGDQFQVIEKFFAGKQSYNDEQLTEAGITSEQLSEYADLRLGIKIRDCIKEKGYCSFNAEF
jgi:hypothetical protein